MAAKRLEGWTLTCGVWPPFPMPALADVRSALREQGILRRESAGMDALYEGWVEAQAWTYALEFDCPEEDERASLRFEMLSGAGAVALNGRALAKFDRGELTVDITGGVQPEKNRLEVAFEPGAPGGLPRGILGPVWLRTTNYVQLRRVRATASEGVIKVASDLVAHTAGRFLFKYQVSLDDEMVLASEVFERLRAAEAHVAHVLKLPSPVKWDGAQHYTVRLAVERSGVGCDSVLLNAAMDAPAPRRILCVPAEKLRNRDLIRALRNAGAEAVQAPLAERANALIPLDLLPDGLLMADGADPGARADLLALPEPRALEKLAGGERYWPPGTPVWRATGSPCPPQQAAEALYGANALGDAARYARLSRFQQAEAIRTLALGAQRAGEAFAVWAAEERPALASIALIEHSGKARPAYGALKQAWAACAAFEFPEPFEASLPLKVWLYPDGPMQSPATVTASLHRMDGSLIASTSFAAMAAAGAPSFLGELKATLPEEGIVIARAELSDGDRAIRIDQVVCLAKPGAPARGALLNPPRADLRVVDGAIVNAGQAAALGLAAGGFYGALLPGEKVALPGGIPPEDIESLNGLIV